MAFSGLPPTARARRPRFISLLLSLYLLAQVATSSCADVAASLALPTLRSTPLDLAMRQVVASANAASERGVVQPNIGSLRAVQSPAATSAPSLHAAAASQPVNEAAHVVWRPQPGKFLLLFCLFGRLSNQVSCIKKTLRLAVILNRTLLVPPSSLLFFRAHLDEVWPLDLLVDWGRLSRCLASAYGPSTVISFPEYFALHNKTKVVVPRVHCVTPGSVEGCATLSVMRVHQSALGATLQFPPFAEYPKWVLPSRVPPSRHGVPEADVAAALGGLQEEVLCVGEAFGLPFRYQLGSLNLTRPPACNNIWHPHPAVTGFVDTVVAQEFGDDFAAIHLRRGDFYLESVLAKKMHKLMSAYAHYSPIAEVARLVARKLNAANVSSVYIASDAGTVELQFFKSLLTELTSITKIVLLKDLLYNPKWLSSYPWSAELRRLVNKSAAKIPWILADKGICARAKIFVGTAASTFSLDISEMRCNERRSFSWDLTTHICSVSGCLPHPCPH